MIGKFNVPVKGVSALWRFMKKEKGYSFRRDREHWALPNSKHDNADYTQSDWFVKSILSIRYDPEENRINFEWKIKERWKKERVGTDGRSGAEAGYDFTFHEIRTCYIQL